MIQNPFFSSLSFFRENEKTRLNRSKLKLLFRTATYLLLLGLVLIRGIDVLYSRWSAVATGIKVLVLGFKL